MRVKERMLLYFLLFILVLTKLQYLFKAKGLLDGWELSNLFIADTIVKHHVFLPHFFHIHSPYAGGGDYLYSLLSIPFVYFFGSNLFAIRILTIPLNIIELSLLFYIVNRYWSWVEALIVSLLFIFCSKFIYVYSIVGMGRHFHLGLFFLLSLLFYLKFKEGRGYISALLFGLSMGVGNYFYPAFEVFIVVFLIFFLFEINWCKASDYFKAFIVFFSTMLAGLFYKVIFLNFNISHAFKDTLSIATNSPKAIFPIDNIFIIVKRFFSFLYFLISDFLSFNLFFHGEHFSIFKSFEKISIIVFFQNIFEIVYFKNTFLKVICVDLYRVVFIILFTAIFFYIFNKEGKIKQNIAIAKFKNKEIAKRFIVILIVVIILFYSSLYAFNVSSTMTYKYYLPLFIPIVLSLAVVIGWKKTLFLPLLTVLLIPGLMFQIQTLRVAGSRECPLLPIYYCDSATLEFLSFSSESDQKQVIDLNVNAAHTLGYIFADQNRDYSTLALLAENNNFKEQAKRFLWEGWSSRLLLNNGMDIDYMKRYLISLTKEERFFVFSGIGEAISKKSKNYLSMSKNFNNVKKSILEAMDSDEKSYFYQGLGRGLARLYCSNVYSAKGPYMANKELFYCYLQLIDKSNIENFIDGFLTRELWQPL